jgi:hypothetical protein
MFLQRQMERINTNREIKKKERERKQRLPVTDFHIVT